MKHVHVRGRGCVAWFQLGFGSMFQLCLGFRCLCVLGHLFCMWLSSIPWGLWLERFAPLNQFVVPAPLTLMRMGHLDFVGPKLQCICSQLCVCVSVLGHICVCVCGPHCGLGLVPCTECQLCCRCCCCCKAATCCVAPIYQLWLQKERAARQGVQKSVGLDCGTLFGVVQ